jgi:hypothetical protein
MRGGIVGCLVVGTLAAGCAGYRVQRDGQGEGYDVYAPEPYLAGRLLPAKAGEPAAYHFEVIWLPDRTRRYRVSSWSGLGKADFQFTFADGWKLTQLNDKSDNTEVLKQIVGLARHLLPEDALFARPETLLPPEPGPPAPLLWRFVYDACGRVLALEPVPVTSGRPGPRPAGA